MNTGTKMIFKNEAMDVVYDNFPVVAQYTRPGLFGSNRTISLLYLNIRSMKNKLLDLECIIKSFKVKIHLICITETWLSDGVAGFIELPGYSHAYSCRPHRRGGGVSIFVENDLT
jgi:hypothetical protein